MIEYIKQFGDQIALHVRLSCDELSNELQQFESDWSQYNTLKPWITRQGLCILNERGEVGPGPALNAIHEWNRTHGTNFRETDFNKPTEVYHASKQVRHVMKDILPFCVRTQFQIVFVVVILSFIFVKKQNYSYSILLF